MPDTKNFSLRVSTLDSLLKKKEGISMKEMMNELNDRLDLRGATHVQSKITILRDMDEIRNRFYARIIRFHDPVDARIIRYRYADMNYSICNLLPLLLEHRCQLELIFRFCSICLGPPFIIWAKELFDMLKIPMTLDKMGAYQLDHGTKTLLANIFKIMTEDDNLYPIDSGNKKTINDWKILFKKK